MYSCTSDLECPSWQKASVLQINELFHFKAFTILMLYLLGPCFRTPGANKKNCEAKIFIWMEHVNITYYASLLSKSKTSSQVSY